PPGTGRWLAPGQLVEEAQHGPAVGAATDVLLCLPTLARRQRRIPGPTLSRAEQDRHALMVIHGHIPMTTGRPRLWRGRPAGGSFRISEGDTQPSTDALQLARHPLPGQVQPQRDLLLTRVLHELGAGGGHHLPAPAP